MKEAEQTGLRDIEKLLQIMSMLRDSTFGCPWDLKQSFASLTRYTLEEVYEVVDAIENNALDQLRDELGDLLFQVVFYAQLAHEAKHFDFGDVVAGIADKLLRRHPHVFPQGKLKNFGQPQQLSPEQVVENWEAIKGVERAQKASSRGVGKEDGVLANIPLALPALERALKIQGRAAQVGFDWPDAEAVLAKVKEEIAELELAIHTGETGAIEDELGDLLFAVVNLARHQKVDAETALRSANRKFHRRFAYIEEQLKARKQQFTDVNLEQLDVYWEEAKRNKL